METTVGKVVYNTDDAVNLGNHYVGEYGDPKGYEEQLYVTGEKKYFIYGLGGADSPYIEPTIKPITADEAEEWQKANNIV